VSDLMEPIDIATPPPERRRIPIWLRWIAGIMATITAVAVVWTLQRPVVPPLDPNWAPQCPRLEGEWKPVWSGDPAQYGETSPNLIDGHLFQQTVVGVPAHNGTRTPAERDAFQWALRDMQGRSLFEWTGFNDYSFALVGDRLIAMERAEPLQVPMRDLKTPESPVELWDVAALLRDHLPSAKVGQIRAQEYRQLLLLSIDLSDGEVPSSTYLCLLDPRAREFRAGYHWTEGDVRVLSDESPGPGHVRLQQVGGDEKVFDWNYETNTLLALDSSVSAPDSRSRESAARSVEPGPTVSWPAIGSQSNPTYVSSVAPGSGWNRYGPRWVFGEPPVGLVVEYWSNDPVHEAAMSISRISYPVAESAFWAAAHLDAAFVRQNWRHVSRQMGGAWLIRNGDNGAEQIPLDAHFVAGVEHNLQSVGTAGIAALTPPDESFAISQLVRAEHLENDGILRIGKLNEARDGLEWLGYWPLPEMAQDETLPLEVGIVCAREQTWIWMTVYPPNKSRVLHTYWLQAPPFDRLNAKSAPSSPLVQNDPGH